MKTESEILKTLASNPVSIENDVKNDIDRHRLNAIADNNERDANKWWCIEQIYTVINAYLSLYHNLKNGQYEDAWHYLCEVDTEQSFLFDNKESFDFGNEANDKFGIFYIRNHLKYIEKMYPYEWFTSREEIIREEKCSICSKTISVRHPCGHRPGKLYMGELCLREVTKVDFKGLAIVKDPFDKYAIIKPKDMEYNYGSVKFLADNISDPWEMWYLKESRTIRPDFKKAGRNDKCPCGSGKKYKHCCMGSDKIYMPHYDIILPKPKQNYAPTYIATTWK